MISQFLSDNLLQRYGAVAGILDDLTVIILVVVVTFVLKFIFSKLIDNRIMLPGIHRTALGDHRFDSKSIQHLFPARMSRHDPPTITEHFRGVLAAIPEDPIAGVEGPHQVAAPVISVVQIRRHVL